MALTESNLLEIGKAAPDFSLKDTVTGSICVLNNLKGDKGTVVMFICNHCPYVVHIIDGLIDLANDYNERGISFVAISDFIFDTNSILVNPEEESKKLKFENIETLHLSIYSILSIAEIGENNKGLEFKKDKSNLLVLRSDQPGAPTN